ncbi:MAG: hypothetical protein ABI367_02315 [Mucilaginibacter sp.]
MKRLVFSALMICALGFNCLAQSLSSVTIKISPLAQGDKPIPTLYICSVKSELYENKFFNKITITDEPSLKIAMAFINTHPTAIKGLAKKSYPFGSFQIALYNKKEYMGGYVLGTADGSKKYLQGFIDALVKGKADELLTDELQSLLNRIK